MPTQAAKLFFLLTWSTVGGSGMSVRRVIALAHGLLSWCVRLLGSVKPKSGEGWTSHRVPSEKLHVQITLALVGSTRNFRVRYTHGFSRPLEEPVFRCVYLYRLLRAEANSSCLCSNSVTNCVTTVHAALSPGRCMDRHLETSQIYARYSRGPFTEEIIDIKIVVPLKAETENILKESMSISSTVLKNYLTVRK